MDKKKDPRGRKPAEDPKVCLRLYINTSVINAAGGWDAAVKLASASIVRKASKNKTTKSLLNGF